MRSRSYGFLRLPEARPDRRDARGELVHVGLAEDDRAGLFELAHQERIARRVKASERDRPRAGRHLDGLVVVLDQHGDAVERPARAARLALGIERVSGLAGARVEHRDRIERRTALIVGVDPRQVEIDQLPRRHIAGLLRPLQLFDRLLHEVVRRKRRGHRLRAPRLSGKGTERCDEQDESDSEEPERSAHAGQDSPRPWRGRG